MGGQLGGDRVTVQNLQVLKVIAEHNLLLIGQGTSGSWTLANTRWKRNGTGVPFFTVLQPSDRLAAVAPLQPHHKYNSGKYCQ